MVACATVSRTVGSVSAVFSVRFGAVETTVRLLSVGASGQAGVDRLVVPGAAQPGVFGVVDDLPGAFGAGSGHDVEVVHVVAGRGDRRAVIAVRHQHDVAGAHLLEHLDGALRRAVHAVVAEPAVSRPGRRRSRSSRSPRVRVSVGVFSSCLCAG